MSLMDELFEVLSQDSRFVSTGNELLRNVIVEHALKLDTDLLELLFKNEKIKRFFFKRVGDFYVFDREKFVSFLNNKEFLPGSYTAFKNKIGLVGDNNQYLAQSREVVLVWPYKDCVLEGGQKKPGDKRKEIFHNVILSADEIDVLLEPKVFTGFKRISVDGERPLSGFNRSKEFNKKRGLPEDTITDNLIIRGNNLLVLHSLLREFRGKIKLIYIDPPYNTGGDEFLYNDSFNESTWLTFMKNRLEVAKELLRDDGAIFISIDHHENHVLKQLCIEIFGRDNFVQEIVVKTSTPTGFKIVNPGPVKVTEYVLIFARNKSAYLSSENELFVPDRYDEEYSKIIVNFEEDYRVWRVDSLRNLALQNLGEEMMRQLKKKNKKLHDWLLKEEMARLAIENAERVFSTKKPHKPAPALREVIEKSKKEPSKFFKYDKRDGGVYYVLNGRLLAFYSSKLKIIDGVLTPAKHLTNLWDDISWSAVDKEGGVHLPNGKKPEKLLKRIIELSTREGDIVLDFFMGTGTTCAVAHKLGRQYIGIEQLDYGENSAVNRLKNVISGDQTGISKNVGWQGGGEFVYMELFKLNEEFIEKILSADSSQELLLIWEEMKERGVLDYHVDSIEFEKNIGEFKKLNLDEQKKLLLEMLDYNELYVNYSDIEDEFYEISDEDKRLNHDFYGIKKNTSLDSFLEH